MSKKAAILWFRQDLRMHDNEALCEALTHADEVLPVYVFDPRTFGGKTRQFGFPKTGSHRAQFILESVADLRDKLRLKGADLLLCIGKPEEILPKLAEKTRSSWVFCNRERTQEEKEVQLALEHKLWLIGREIRFSRGKMLYYTSDLPFPISHTPDVFTQFRKEVERIVPIRKPLQEPAEISLPTFVDLDYGELPTLADFGLAPPPEDERAALKIKGGETEGLARLQHYLWNTDAISTYKETRNGLIGPDYSTKFSLWLAQGCLSPKYIYHAVKAYEAERGANESTYWVFFELLWRDFFRLQAKKYNERIFLRGGTKEEVDPRLRNDWKLLRAWIEGQTGSPFIDANMREIAQTGFMSNRGRQNVASYLVKDLHVNWQMGAEYFESVLIDYDPASNWGNWNYIAGVGADPRENRYFNILTQANRYDPQGEYAKLWCPELAKLPSEFLHKPDQLSSAQQAMYEVKIGSHYPLPLVPSKKWEGSCQPEGKPRSRRNKGGSKYGGIY